MRNVHRSVLHTVCAAVLSVGFATSASAQTSEDNSTSFQVERFEPMPAQGINVLNLATSDVVPHSKPTGGLFMHYVNDPLVQRDASNEEEEVVAELISGQFKAELWAGIGFMDWLDIGLVLPIVLAQSGDELSTLFDTPQQQVEGLALSDLRLVPKAQLMNADDFMGFGLAIVPTLILPTGDSDTFNSDGKVKFEPRLVADWRHEMGYLATVNLAYLFRPETFAQNYVSNDVLRWGVGGYVPFPEDMIEGMGVVGTLFGDIQLAQNRSVDDFEERLKDGTGSPVEWDLGLQYDLPYNLVANLGGGTGLSRGVGAPKFRIFASIGYTPRAVDTDGDGYYDNEDGCPLDPEDFDQFEDADGCPDLDNDQDGILDTDDQCPNNPEDIDGFEDEDGCPDTDNDQDTIPDVEDDCPNEPGPVERNGCPENDRDGDGILDEVDKCPDDPEDKDGFEDEDGCPDLDNDKDGLLDPEDKCPNEPEDKDGFQDGDGCPDPDNDGDGILDVDDKCPLQPETVNGVEDEDGCPEDVKVRVTTTKIEILEKVFFDTAKATIKKRSFGLLNDVAAVLQQNKQITKIRIEGHTDDRGSDKYNQDLSERRAASVRTYLIEQGVDEGRLESKGYGESTPIADNKTSAGRDQNRRVEFTIIEIDGKATSTDEVKIEKKETVIESKDGKTETKVEEEAKPANDAKATDSKTE